MSYYKKGCEPQNQRYIDDGFEAIEEQSFTDTETDRTYYVDYFDEIVDLVNEQDKTIKELSEENEQLKKDLKKKFVPFAKADGDYTTVNTEEFIKIVNENEQLKKEKNELLFGDSDD